MAERLKELVLSDKGRRIMIVGALAVMLLLLLSTVSCGGDGKSENYVSPISGQTENAAEIERELERRLEQLISQIDGAGSVTVMVTLDTVSERVYEKDKRSEGSSAGDSKSFEYETEVVLSGSSKQPLQVSSVLPRVRGAAVVCPGAADPLIRERVTNIVAKALNIGVSKVYVTY